MSHTKVLLLASVKDMASITRESRIKASPLLSGYEMGYFYLIELTQEEFERGEIILGLAMALYKARHVAINPPRTPPEHR
jgi:hypothetical protein